MNLLCETGRETCMAVTQPSALRGCAGAALGPDPLALHALGGRPAPVEAAWALLSEFILTAATEPREGEAVIRWLRETEGDECVASFALAGLKGAEMVGHIQAAHARARLGRVSAYLEASLPTRPAALWPAPVWAPARSVALRGLMRAGAFCGPRSRTALRRC